MSNQTTGVNKLLLLSTLLLMSFGIVVVYTACTQHALRMGLAPEYYLKKHCMMVLVTLLFTSERLCEERMPRTQKVPAYVAVGRS